ncbi:MAG TPA: AcvB/VirJ family lysyl-phosphatidylglycerol hydrolase [Steroidobacteraceae bacterium]|nr:AcvB/VirJ family lysyl-phosphatidylglycerol hydrolase [Steroidobacteraceae bacterium]
MSRIGRLAMGGALLMVGPAGAAPAPAAESSVHVESVSHGRFQDLALYYPTHGTPSRVALVLSAERGWDDAGAAIATVLAEQGALVAGIDLKELEASFAADRGCGFPDGDLENLSHFIQAYRQLPSYEAPLLVGYGGGATLAYAMLVQAPAHTFSGALTLGFCPATSWRVPLCAGAGLRSTPRAHPPGLIVQPTAALHDPWVSLEGEHEACNAHDFIAAVRGAARAVLPLPRLDRAIDAGRLAPLRAAYLSLAREPAGERLPPPPAALGGLPLIEVSAQPVPQAPSDLAILISGDGGWAGLDKAVAQALAAAGIPTVGLDSLRYFWSARTPEGLAGDLDRIIRYYLAALGKQRVLLIGYSQGANVLPFALNRLPAATRARVALTALLGLSEHALFEFHVSSWVAENSSGPSTLAEIDRIATGSVLCIYGEDEKDSPCPRLDPGRFKIMKLAGGHHFDGDYAALARKIIESATP